MHHYERVAELVVDTQALLNSPDATQMMKGIQQFLQTFVV